MNRFPHLVNSTPYPTTDINVYKYRNEFDYTRYTGNVKIKLCVVPWCGDYDNTVKFDDDNARDAYLDALSGIELETMFNLLPDTTIKVPLPATNVQLYNYCIVDLPIMAPPENPVEYADEPRIERYCYFIGDVRQNSTNASECDLTLDVWTTYINHITFSYVMLDRGHAPMAEVSVDDYLTNPNEYSEYLTTPDVVIEGAPNVVTDENVINFTGGDMWFAMATNADVESVLWGEIDEDNPTAATPVTPHMPYYTTQGCPSPRVYAIDIDDIYGFFEAVEEQRPQYMACIEAVFLIEKDLAVRNDGATYPTVEFCGYTLTRLTAGQHRYDVMDVSEANFDFPEPYNKITKLYTYPYSYIRISHEDGESTIVRIENLTDTLQMRVCAQITFPYLAIDTNLLNIGGLDTNMTFQNEGERSFTYGGHFAEYFKRHNVPSWYVVQESKVHATWAHLYDRLQARIAAENDLDSATTTAENTLDASTALAYAAYQNSLASASTTYSNQTAASSTAYNNTLNNYNVQLDNMELAISRNDDVTNYQNMIAEEITTGQVACQDTLTSQDNLLIAAENAAELEGLSVASTNNAIQYNASTSAAAASSIADVAQSVVSGAITGAGGGGVVGSLVPGAGTLAGLGVGAAIGAGTSAIGAIGSYVSASTQAEATHAQTINTNNVVASNNNTLASIAIDINEAKTNANNRQSENQTGYNNMQRSYINNQDNDLQEDSTNNTVDCGRTNASNTYNTEVSNASRSYNTAVANAERTYNADITSANDNYNSAITRANNDYDTAINDIENTFKQQSLEPPYKYGETTNGETAATRPIATWAQIVTQNEGGIRYAGDAFLRYGYQLNQQWEITNLQVMPYYTYWECSEVWCAGDQTVLEGAQNIIKAILQQGVTVWSDPDEIGKVSIYDNI